MKAKTQLQGHHYHHHANGHGGRRWSRGKARDRHPSETASSSPTCAASLLCCRHPLRLLVMASLLYVLVGLVSVGTPALPGSVYRSPEVFRKLRPEMEADNSSAVRLSTVWKYGRSLEEQKVCADSSIGRSGPPAPSGYLIVEANGGLNQQRSSICNAVALGGLLNAILVIPQFIYHNIWMDPSEFKDIYDEDYFIHMLEDHVKVVRELPEILMEKFDYNTSNIPNLRIKAWAPVGYYLTVVHPMLREHGVIRITPFANRLALEVPSHIQSLRCIANFKALRYSASIETLGKKLVNRMIEKSMETAGKYVAVHLRFEEDMVAFSCCVYDGGKDERLEMDSARQRGWRDKFVRRGHVLKPGLNRMNGKCPLTPLEVGMILRGMGFDNTTSIYLASGKIYNAERNLVPLLQLFPLLQTKESLATPEELASFQGYSSRLAALDYIVCLHSEVFVTTQGGNFPHFMMGHRRYLYDGHAKTIKPDKRKFAVLLHNTSISWKSFKEQMGEMLRESDRKGVSERKFKQSVYTYPSPECMCHRDPTNSTLS